MQALPHGASIGPLVSMTPRGLGAGLPATRGGMGIPPAGEVGRAAWSHHRQSNHERDGQRLTLRGGGGGSVDAKIDWTLVAGNLFGGLALFLYGMERMGVGLKNAFGEQLRSILLMLSFSRCCPQCLLASGGWKGNKSDAGPPLPAILLQTNKIRPSPPSPSILLAVSPRLKAGGEAQQLTPTISPSGSWGSRQGSSRAGSPTACH